MSKSRINGSEVSHYRIQCHQLRRNVWQVQWPTRECTLDCFCQSDYLPWPDALALISRMDTALRAAHPRSTE